ncbi:MAG: hypothetical protein AB9M53_01505 [Leptothrix sp. (in: b-proteobacteria)]
MTPAPTHSLVQLLPPGHGGVRDYALALQAQWAAHGRQTWLMDLSAAQVRSRRLADQLADLGRQEPGGAVLSLVLHFSGYGYARRGLCFWLLDELRHARTALGAQMRLLVVFHELYATGPPWRSAFWVSGLQQRIAAQLARQADALWTNSESHAAWLRYAVTSADRRDADLAAMAVVAEPVAMGVQPVFSNVGEPELRVMPGERLPQAIVFGAAPTRQRVFNALRAAPGHGDALRARGIEQLIEVGGGQTDAKGLELARIERGRLDSTALGAALLDSRWALIDYPRALLGKSSVFAAYAAHGCAVLNCRDDAGPDVDGLQRDRHYVDAATWQRDLAAMASGQALEGIDRAEAFTLALCDWYGGHRLADQADGMWALATQGCTE